VGREQAVDRADQVDGRDLAPSTARFHIDLDFDHVAEQKPSFGAPTDTPLAGRIDPGAAYDLVLYRNGAWYVSTAQDGVATMIFGFGGAPGDVPLAADVDGDGIADLAIYRNGVWYVDTNRDGTADLAVHFGGVPGDIPRLFDFDGDGKADLTIVRGGLWYVNTKLDGTAQAIFGYGAPGDVPLGWRE
jgi:hypothetical protein